MKFLNNTLPSRPHLDHLKKQAKQLLQSAQAGEDVPGLTADAQLTDAQFQLAKSYGFGSWQELRQAVEEQQPLVKALRDLAAGKMCILFDDRDRENEGDFVVPAMGVTAEQINFLAQRGRGAICLALSHARAGRLGIEPVTKSPQDADTANFGPSLDLASHHTGISAHDRAATIRALLADDADISQFKTPGHVPTLIGEPGGLEARRGHTEGSLALMAKAGLADGVVICEIMNADGTMARMSDLDSIAQELDLALVTTADLLG